MGFLSRSRRRGDTGEDEQCPADGFGDGGAGEAGGWSDELADAVLEALEVTVVDGAFATGGQAAVYVDGSLAAEAAVGVTGNGQPMLSTHLHHGFCMLKPLPILVLGAAVERAGFGPDDPLSAMCEMPDWCPDRITVRALGSHEAGLARPTAWDWFWARPANRRSLLSELVGSDPEPAYSELVGGLIAEHAIEQLTGQPVADHICDVLLGPLGLCDDIVFGRPGEGMPGGDRLHCTVAGMPRRAVPMLSTLLDEPTTTSPAVGGLVTMRGVAGFYAAVGRTMEGTPVPGLPSPELMADLTAPEHRGYPITSKRYAIWAAGLIHDLDKVNISAVAGPGSVGHMGGVAEGTAVYCRDRRAAAAVFFNGANDSFDMADLMRLFPMDTILKAIPAAEDRDDA